MEKPPDFDGLFRLLRDAAIVLLGILLFFRIVVVVRQTNHRFCARNQPGRVNTQVKIIFHVGHAPMRPLPEPGLQAMGRIVQPGRFRKTYKSKSQAEGFLADVFGGKHGTIGIGDCGLRIGTMAGYFIFQFSEFCGFREFCGNPGNPAIVSFYSNFSP